MGQSNVNQSPILIAGPSRSGTTLLAGLLGKHGVWIGRGTPTKYPETNPNFVSENQDIKFVFKQAAKKEGYINWRAPIPYMNGAYLEKEDIEQFVPGGKRWLIKTSWNLIFAAVLKDWYPNAFWILPWRNKELILDSMNRHPGMAKRSDEVKGKVICYLQSMEKEIFAKSQYAIFSDTKAVSQKKEGELVKLFGFVGIKPDWSVIDEWIQPEIMK